MKKPVVGILYVCTGSYRAFWNAFYENFSVNFLPGCPKKYFVFTDAPHIEHEDDPAVVRFEQEAYEWPFSTLKRFAMFLAHEKELAETDYLFYCNVNLSCARPILELEIFPDRAKGQSLVAVSHVHTWQKDPIFHPYERNLKCRAGIPYNCGTHYVAGGFNGGETKAFLALCHELDARTEADLAEGIIANHHDESQLNRLVAERPEQFRVLEPRYCVPEERPIPGEAIRILQKKRFINIDQVKGKDKPMNLIQRKWEAFNLNWMPYVWLWRDKLLRKHL